jgi:type 1 glutamine amidotransferase
MKCSRIFCLATAAMLSSAAVLPGAEPQPPLRVLLLTGQNNHNWKETTPVLKRILTASRRFTVEVTEHPEQCQPEALRAREVVLSNWNSLGPVKTWPEPFRNAVLEFVRNGGGFVVVHAGGTMFHDWPDFQKMIGATWGAGTGHGAMHSFEVKFTNQQHPITQGLAPFKIKDELWHRMVAQPDKKILATAFSAREHGGSSNDEPMVMVTQFGKGRCFNLVLGHDPDAMENPSFQTLLLRGTEWAATGRVTIATAVDPKAAAHDRRPQVRR